MPEEVAVVGDEAVRQFMTQLVQAAGLSCTYSPARYLTAVPPGRLDRVRMVCLCSPDGSKTLRAVQIIRLQHDFRGTILILSFTPRSWVVGQEGGEAIETAGCFYLQLPALKDDLRALVRQHVSLTAEEMARIRKQLTARRILQAASSLRHDYENRLSLALTHLRSVEKLSHFTHPDVQRVAKEAMRLKEHLSREKVETFRSAVTALLTDAAEWKGEGARGISPPLETEWNEVEAWLQLSIVPVGEGGDEMSEIFARAKRLEAALRNILAAVLNLKEEARRVISHAQ